jgi:WD40 repeat protein
MNPVTCCPEPSRLERLLAASLPEGEQARLVEHLDHCEACRLALERLAAGDGLVMELAREVGQEPPVAGPGLAGGLGQGEVTTDSGRGTDPGTDAPPALDFLDPPDQPGQLGRLGPYQVLEVRGRGGMGVVLKAFEPALHRVVAIKVLAPHLAASATARKRFVREAQAAAAVRDDHVVAIHAVGEAGGLPYLVMEYVEGPSLQERLDREGALPVAEVRRIAAQVAQGLAAAHAHGLVHRDVKPANILLENGVARVKLTDFGLARAALDAHLTQEGVVAGTPHYMAPEQGQGEAVDHRADLFALGSLLYAMCTGRPPFRADTPLAVLKRVCEETPRPAHEVNPAVPEWLGQAITRLQAKDPAERSPSAAELARLLGRRLSRLEEPAAQTASLRAPRRRRRRLWPAAAAVLLAAAALGLGEAAGVTNLGAAVVRIFTPDGVLVVEVQDPGVKVTVEGDGGLVITGAGPQEVRLRPGSYRLRASKDGRPVTDEVVTISRGEKQVVKVRLEAAGRPAAGAFRFKPPPPGPLDRLDRAKIPGEERFPWQPRELVQVLGGHRGRHWGEVVCAAFSPDGKLIASGGTEAIRLWDAETLRERGVITGFGGYASSVAFSPDGRFLLSGGTDGLLHLWDLATGKELKRLAGHTAAIFHGVTFSADGKRALSGGWNGDNSVRLWDLETGKQLRRFTGHTAGVCCVAMSADSRRALSAGDGVRLWDLETGKVLRRFDRHKDRVRSVAFSRDGRFALSSGGPQDLTARLWDVETGRELHCFTDHSGGHHGVNAVALSPDGRRALTAAGDGVRLRDVEAGKLLHCFESVPRRNTLAFAPDGRRAVVAGGDGMVRLLDLEGRKEVYPPRGHTGPVNGVAFSPDGRHVLSAGYPDQEVRYWDVESGREVRRLQGHRDYVLSVAISPDGRQALSGGIDSQILLWDLAAGKVLRRLEGHPVAYFSVRFSPDGRRALASGHGACLWDLATGRLLRVFTDGPAQTTSVAFSPDGRQVLVGGHYDGLVTLWDVESGRELRRLEGHSKASVRVAFAPDGRRAWSCGNDGTVRLWDLGGADPRPRTFFRWHTGAVHAVAIAPDGQTLASAGADGRIILWDAASGARRREWQLPGGVIGVAFASDGRHLAAANANGTVYILRLAIPQPPK